jgi:hypothetical protein
MGLLEAGRLEDTFAIIAIFRDRHRCLEPLSAGQSMDMGMVIQEYTYHKTHLRLEHRRD